MSRISLMEELRLIKRSLDKGIEYSIDACVIIVSEKGTERADLLETEYRKLEEIAREFRFALQSFNATCRRATTKNRIHNHND